MNLIVISLFDGLSGGRLALKDTNLNVLRYYSSEIDKYAIQIADKNFPEDTPYRLGDVTKINTNLILDEIRKDFKDVEYKILLIGGSPCQGFSMAGKLKGSSTKDGVMVDTLDMYLNLKEKGFEFDGQSFLFWEFIRIKEEINPDFWFLENVRITKKWLPMFNETLNTEPLIINSSLMSAQNRVRFYWHNFGEIQQPEDMGITVKDILDSDYVLDEEFNYYKIKPSVLNNLKEQLQYLNPSKSGFAQLKCSSGFQDNKIGITKTPTLRAGNPCCYVQAGKTYFKQISPLEAERLQTLPDNYTYGVSNSQRYRMVGNGWTIRVISYIFNHIK